MKSKKVKSQSDKDSIRSRKTILCCCLDLIICGSQVPSSRAVSVGKQWWKSSSWGQWLSVSFMVTGKTERAIAGKGFVLKDGFEYEWVGERKGGGRGREEDRFISSFGSFGLVLFWEFPVFKYQNNRTTRNKNIEMVGENFRIRKWLTKKQSKVEGWDIKVKRDLRVSGVVFRTPVPLRRESPEVGSEPQESVRSGRELIFSF